MKSRTPWPLPSTGFIMTAGKGVIHRPLHAPSGQVILIRHTPKRCEALTRRGTRCRFRGCITVFRIDPKTSGAEQHATCKIHGNTWRWW